MSKQWTTCTLVVFWVAGGCAMDMDNGSLEVDRSTQWLCEASDGLAVCGAAIPAPEAASMAYSCLSGETESGCPSTSAITDLEAVLEDAPGLGDAVWACLLTGEHQRRCLLDLDALMLESTLEPTEAAPEPAEPTPASEAPTPTEGAITAPEPPSDCSIAAWEDWFHLEANFEFQSAGFDINFPREIFDASATVFLNPGVTVRPRTVDPRSCEGPEWQMRDQAWLTAITQRCLDLSDPIVVLCQQAADYAPTTGECTASGVW